MVEIIRLIVNPLSYLCLGIGIVFWVWGTSYLLGRRTVLYKLHSLSVSDTLGSIAIIVGLLLKIPREWPLLILAILCLAMWNTMLGYVLAYCSQPESQVELPIPNSPLSNSQLPNSPTQEVQDDWSR